MGFMYCILSFTVLFRKQFAFIHISANEDLHYKEIIKRWKERKFTICLSHIRSICLFAVSIRMAKCFQTLSSEKKKAIEETFIQGYQITSHLGNKQTRKGFIRNPF